MSAVVVKRCRVWPYLVRPQFFLRLLGDLWSLTTVWQNSGRKSVLPGLSSTATHPLLCQNLIRLFADLPRHLKLRTYPILHQKAHYNEPTQAHLYYHHHRHYTMLDQQLGFTTVLNSDHYTLNLNTEGCYFSINMDVRGSIIPIAMSQSRKITAMGTQL